MSGDGAGNDPVDWDPVDWPIVTTPALTAQDIPADGLHGRLVIVSSREDDAVGAVLRDVAGRRRGWRLVPATRAAAAMAELLVGWDLGRADLGPPSLVTAPQWLIATRRLLATLVGADRTGSRGLVLHVPGPAWQLMYLRRIVPDATYLHVTAEPTAEADIAAREWNRRIAELTEPTDRTTTSEQLRADVAPLLGPPPRRRRPGRRRVGRRPRSAPRLLVVVGSGRSGTTWLHNMLCAHPGINGTQQGETSVFRLLQSLWADGGPDRRLLAALRRFCDETLIAPLSGAGVRYVSEKTPAHVWSIPLVRRLYPDARFVHIVRDGRDVAMSLCAMEDGFTDLATAAGQWARTVDAVENGLADARDLARTVRYEELTDDPPAHVRAIWHWLGLPDDSDADETLVARTHLQVTPVASRRAPGSGRWRDLAAGDLAVLVDACGPALQRWGYPGTDDPR